MLTEEQIRNWLEEEIKRNPGIADQYVAGRLAHLQMKLRDSEHAYNREGYACYHNPYFADEVKKTRNEIQEIEAKSAEEVFIERMTSKFADDILWAQGRVEEIKNSTDEDIYIRGVFRNAGWRSISSKEDLELVKANINNEENLKEIDKIYKKGLSNREKYVKEGEKLNRLNLEALEPLTDIDKRGPEIIEKAIEEDKKYKNHYGRALAKMSVVDAFDQLGAHPEPKRAEEIEKIIEAHNPEAVEAAIQAMIENPTDNMIALARNIRQAPVQSRDKLKMMKAFDVIHLAIGGTLMALGITGTILGTSPAITAAAIGALDFGIGAAGLSKHMRKTDNLDQKEGLMDACIEDLLNEIELREIFYSDLYGKPNKELGK